MTGPSDPPTPPVATEVLDDSMPEYWAPEINGHLGHSLEYAIKAGRALLSAKAKLGPGNFQKMFSDGMVKVDLRTGQMLMRIAGNPALADAHNYARVPQTLNSLYLLSGLKEKKLQKAIDAGRITPALSIAETKAFVAKLEPGSGKAKTPASQCSGDEGEHPTYGDADLEAAHKRIVGVLAGELSHCPDQAWINRLAAKVVEYLHTRWVTYTEEKAA
jgi:hypothetical protein